MIAESQTRPYFEKGNIGCLYKTEGEFLWVLYDVGK